MNSRSIIVAFVLCTFVCTTLSAQSRSDRRRRSRDRDSQRERPLVLGHGVGRFQVGPVLERDRFEDLDNWEVQLQQRDGYVPAVVEAKNRSLDCFVPGRGCTVWYKEKLPPRIAITYDVVCPTHDPPVDGLLPRDINQFWMATDPTGNAKGLFDSSRYTGDFGTHGKMHGYYASTGGGRNTTTRMRRYPREIDGQPAAHLALKDRDGQPDFLITPNQVMKIQLVAYDDLIQYIVDRKLVYEIRRGDSVQVETLDGNGKRVSKDAIYDTERFPVYREGYFGFRMVGTHHIYRHFHVHALDPDEGTQSERERRTLKVSSLNEFRSAIAESHQKIILEPGDYTVSDRWGFRMSGSNNEIVLDGTSIKVPLGLGLRRSLFVLSGNHITLRGGKIESTYPDGSSQVSDFGKYNRGKTYGGLTDIVVPGDDNQLTGLKLIVRGSFPYGYGNMYGIGAGSVVNLQKHCGILVTGDRAVIEGCDVKMEAFGHAIFVQGGDRTTVRNTVVEGTLRPSNDCYNETHDDDLAKRSKYRLQWPENVRGIPIPKNHMINCVEDGIRAYKGAGHMEVENCVVKKMRGGIKLYMAKSATVSDCEVYDCVIQGYSLPSRGEISNSVGNAAYGPLLYVHADNHADQSIDLQVVPAPHSLGDHPLAAIKGRGHSIKLRSDGSPETESSRPIIVGYKMRFDFLSVDYPEVPDGYQNHFAKYAPDSYRASNIKLNNETGHPVVLGEQSRDNIVTSVAPVRDDGQGNQIATLSSVNNKSQ